MADVAALANDMLVVRDPEDGAIVGEVPVSTSGAIEAALDRGMAALRAPALPAHRRADILRQVADRVAADAAGHAELIAREGVKTIREARGEVARAVETLRLSADGAKRIGGQVVPFDQAPSGEGRTGWWTLRPAGLVVAITPYNDPLNLVAHKLGPAFALGAPVILKPHPQTPFSALRLIDHFHAAGAPENMIQVLIGGAEVGATLVADARPRIVSFTGGHAAGAAIAARSGIKRLMLELGGVGVVAVAADADLDAAIAAIHSGAFWAAGQNCVHAQRIVADASVVDMLTERLVARAGAMTLGAKLDPATDMGPMVDAAAARRVEHAITGLRQAGGRVLTGGTIAGTRVAPTWIDSLPAGHALLDEELFGPVATIESAADEADLLSRLADASDAIHAAVFTRSIATAMAAYERANAAALIVNDSTDFRIDAMPFGGVGGAGLGREGVADAIAEMSDKKLMVIRA